MNKVKIFRIKGEISSPNYKTSFLKDLRALAPKHAIEKVYTDFGSQHRVKRRHINIISIKEITVEETEDPLIKILSEER